GARAAMAARMYANNGAKAAIEIALHDLVGRATNRPVYALLGGKQRSRMPVLGVIGTGERSSDLREAEKKKAEGYVAFKIKVGIDAPGVDGERTRHLCRILGPDALISSDANQGWSSDEALQYVRAVAEDGLAFFEQPVAADDLSGMAAIAAALPQIAWGLTLTNAGLSEDVTAQPLRIAQGHVEVSDRPGLGIEVDEERLRRFRRGGPVRQVA